MDFNIGLSGLNATNIDLAVISNNIANSSTIGFKTSRTEFGDIYQVSALQNHDSRIGGGVIVAGVTQDFSQGQIEFTNGSFDLAVNGSGLLVFKENERNVYSRAGNLNFDKDGYIVNVLKSRLQGYLADNTGHITGEQGDLVVKRVEDEPQATKNVTVTVNLDAATKPPSAPFVRGFDPNNPPDPSTYNTSTAATIYDSLGITHVLTSYFVKSSEGNNWETFIGIDGIDVTPAAAPLPPLTPPATYPVSYPQGVLASPYTLVFNQNGLFVPNNPLQPPKFYGPGPITNQPQGLLTSGTLPKLNPNDLIINDVTIYPALDAFDPVSTSDNSASAISLATAINQTTGLHGVTATLNPNETKLGAYTPGAGVFAAGNFTINGVSITGTAVDENALLGLINAQTDNTGVTATGGGNVTLTTADGRNIQLQTNGISAGPTFATFNLAGGTVLNETQAGTINLATNNNNPMIISGKNPSNARLTAGPQIGIVQTSSDPIVIADWTPTGGAAGPQVLNIDFSPSTEYGAPFSVLSVKQDGYSTGVLTGLNIDHKGIIFANYSNGRALALGQIELAFFNNMQGLQSNGNTGWLETIDSGMPIISAPGSGQLGLIQWRALEGSNVDLTDQLIGLIVAQRNFQANAQSIKTADSMTQTIINLR